VDINIKTDVLKCFKYIRRPSWSWSYGSWIYNYL